MLVVDTNVLAYFLVEGEKTAQARRLWEIDPAWHAPPLLTYELTNVFVSLVRQGAVGAQEAAEGLDSGLALVRLARDQPPPARILEIATKLRISAYDAAYLAAAEMLDAPLVTEDARILGASSRLAFSLEAMLSQSTG